MKKQSEGIIVEMQETGSEEAEVWGSDDYDIKQCIKSFLTLKTFLCNSISFLLFLDRSSQGEFQDNFCLFFNDFFYKSC